MLCIQHLETKVVCQRNVHSLGPQNVHSTRYTMKQRSVKEMCIHPLSQKCTFSTAETSLSKKHGLIQHRETKSRYRAFTNQRAQKYIQHRETEVINAHSLTNGPNYIQHRGTKVVPCAFTKPRAQKYIQHRETKVVRCTFTNPRAQKYIQYRETSCSMSMQ